MLNEKTLLLVEDVFLLAQLTKASLEKYGYTVIHTETGEEAIDLMRENKEVDLISRKKVRYVQRICPHSRQYIARRSTHRFQCHTQMQLIFLKTKTLKYFLETNILK